jgi:MFS family permease
VWLLYVLLAAQAVVTAVDGPARRTFLPRLLPARQIPAGAALNMLAIHASVTAGPAVAGLVTAAAGLKICYLVDAVTFLAALYGIVGLPAMPPTEKPDQATLRSVGEGISFITRSRVLAGALLADMNATVLGFPFAVFPAFNAEHFSGSSQTLGLLMAAPAVGGIIGSALSGPVGAVLRQGRAILMASCVWGISLIAFGLSSALWLALLLLVFAGIADVVSVILRTSLVQVVTPDRYRGRVSSADYIVGAALPMVGYFRAGAVAEFTSPAISVVTGGIAVLAGTGLIGLAMPAFRRYTPQPSNVTDEVAGGIAT